MKDRIGKMLAKLEPDEKDLLLSEILVPKVKPYMTAAEFSKASGIPEKRIRVAIKGPYKNKITVSDGKMNSTVFINTKAFLKLWDERKLI